ncbi:MAG: 30S ribosomal protein S16 [Anaerolineae bacterium]|jgi:small subunit ribosomal protein S16|nr:30S ribosomal protein S16 [Anaerolineae bacterium]
MLRIRFQRVGAKRQASYRLVVMDQRAKRSGGIVENIGFHNPRTRPSTDEVNFERALYWLSVGAKPTEAAESVLKRVGVLPLVARIHKGESIEALAAEATAAKAAAAVVSPRTSYPAPTSKGE